jgi:hypothetical protein
MNSSLITPSLLLLLPVLWASDCLEEDDEERLRSPSRPSEAKSDVSDRNLFKPPAGGLEDDDDEVKVEADAAAAIAEEPPMFAAMDPSCPITGSIRSSITQLAGRQRIFNNAPSPHPTSSTLLASSLRKMSSAQLIRCSANEGVKTTPTWEGPFSIMLTSRVWVREVERWMAEGEVRVGS